MLEILSSRREGEKNIADREEGVHPICSFVDLNCIQYWDGV